MFSSLTATGVVNAAGNWTPTITPVALVVVGLAVAVGLTGWVVRKLRSAAH
jgi:fumarate reductase subunit D